MRWILQLQINQYCLHRFRTPELISSKKIPMSTTFSVILLVFVQFFCISLASSSGILNSSPLYSRRSILRDIKDGKESENVEKPDFAVELNATNFDDILRDTPATYAIVEFFALWSPACRKYKPHYERVARLFNGPDAVHPGIILMTRVDCASKINTNLCDKFSVSHFPMLFWGPPSKFVSGSWDPKKENSDIRPIDNGRTADRLLGWINNQRGREAFYMVGGIEEVTAKAEKIAKESAA